MKNLINNSTAVRGYEDRFFIALEAIKNGGRFNGTVYVKRVSTQNRDVSVYVDGEFFALGRYHWSDAEEAKQVFLDCIKILNSEENPATNNKEVNLDSNEKLVNTGLGYHAKESELDYVTQFGFDGIEANNYY